MTTATPVMPELKSATQKLHDDTEHGTFNKRLVMGQLPREAYVEMLGQLFLMHRALESNLRAALDRNPEWRLLNVPTHHQIRRVRKVSTFCGPFRHRRIHILYVEGPGMAHRAGSRGLGNHGLIRPPADIDGEPFHGSIKL